MNIKSFFATFHWVPRYTLFVLWATFKESFQKALLSVTGGHEAQSKSTGPDGCVEFGFSHLA